jgi:hypothetical protein
MVHCDETLRDAYSQVEGCGEWDAGTCGASNDDYVDTHTSAEVSQILEGVGISAQVIANINKNNVDGRRFLDCSTNELSAFLCDNSTSDLRVLLAVQTYIRQTLQTENFFIDNGEW